VHNFNALVIHRTVLHYVSFGYSQDNASHAVADQWKLLNISGSIQVAICVGDELMRLISTNQTMYESYG